MSKTPAASRCEPAFLGRMTQAQICRSIRFHLKFDRCKNWGTATDFDKYLSLALTIRDMAVERMIATQGAYLDHDVKRVYYLSMEFLLGRLLTNNMIAIQAGAATKQALKQMKLDLECLSSCEADAGLGNGGLGRLAACFLDSLATQEYPAYGYGLRYEHGMFRQELEDGWQRELPDDWLKYGYPWEMVRPEYAVRVPVYGRLLQQKGRGGEQAQLWLDWQEFEGLPYDIPIIGYANNTVNFLRLWHSRSHAGFRLDVFNQGDYVQAVQQENWAEIVTKVLYPSDNTSAGRELRLVQEYFLVSCSIRDIIRRFQKKHSDWKLFAQKNAIQMNDTHPALAVVELMRYFRDEAALPWELAWELTVASLGYTNHTLMAEALEKWPLPLMERVLPRHLQLIYEINQRFLQKVEVRHPGDTERLRRMSLIEESNPKQVRMANLAIVGSHAVNGVSALHSRLLQERVFKDFAQFYPGKFSNKTNGITPRRWLLLCNPGLASLISDTIGDAWIKDLQQLQQLEAFADDRAFQKRFRVAKLQNKTRLAKLIQERTGAKVDPQALFDVQIKRLHEYKRQLLNLMHILTLYQRIQANPTQSLQPRVFIFGAKAAPNYTMAKLIIKLITSLSQRLQDDPAVAGRLQIVFLPDYDVSLAESIVPAADLSEQISTAGHEASGTGNMKLALNGALTIGTWDGANIEIAEAVGQENIFIFGRRVEQLRQMRPLYNPRVFYDEDAELRQVIDAIATNRITADGDPALFARIYRALMEQGDRYFHLADYRDYLDCQQRVAKIFSEQRAWDRMAILNVARMGRFSSDRTVREYARDIWQVQPLPIDLSAPIH